MSKLIEKCIEVISCSNLYDLIYDWEYSSYCVKFKKENKDYEFEFRRQFLGLISEITLTGDFSILSNERITKDQFNILKDRFNKRIDEINKSSLNKVFPDIQRDNKLKDIIGQ